MPRYPHERVATLALLAVTLVWGSSFVLTKWALDQVDPLDFLFWRFIMATVALLLIRPRSVAELSPLARRRGLVIGLFLGAGGRLPSFDEARDEFTRSYLSQILQITGGNVSQAARLARRNRTDFYKLLGRHQLTPEDFKQR